MALFRGKTYTEEELVRLCVANDRSAQEALYRRYFPVMLRMVRRHTRDDDTAIEVVNTGMLRAFMKMHTFEHKGSLEGWLRRLVYHAMANYFRQNARYLHFLVLDDNDFTETTRGAVQPVSMDEEDILRAVKHLPANAQEVFRLYAIEGYSHAEVAEAMQISEGTSKWLLSTARQKLKDLLNRLDDNHQGQIHFAG